MVDVKSVNTMDSKWKGTPIDELPRDDKKDVYFPPLEPSSDHICMIELPIESGVIPKPFPPTLLDEDEDYSMENVVTLPYSKHYFHINEEGRRVSHWEMICESLSTPIRNSEQLENAILKYQPAKFRSLKLSVLHNFFARSNEDDEEHFFSFLLPEMISLAKKLPEFVTRSIPGLKGSKTKSVTFSQWQVACLLANAFFCTYPPRIGYPTINFLELFANTYRLETSIEKLRCLFYYFHYVISKPPVGTITFTRHWIPHNEFSYWELSEKLLTKLHVSSEGTIEDDGIGMYQVDFANKCIGGGVLGAGCVQEEIRFVINPELIVSRLFVENMGNDEAIIITGSERFNQYKGYGPSFRWNGKAQRSQPVLRDVYGRACCHVVAIDAYNFFRNAECQYTNAMLKREVNKAYAGFSFGVKESYPPCAVATGNWGCGVFQGDVELKSLLQIIAASECGRDVVYFTFANPQLRDRMASLHQFLTENFVPIGDIWRILRVYAHKRKEGLRESVFDFITSAVKNPSVLGWQGSTFTLPNQNSSTKNASESPSNSTSGSELKKQSDKLSGEDDDTKSDSDITPEPDSILLRILTPSNSEAARKLPSHYQRAAKIQSNSQSDNLDPAAFNSDCATQDLSNIQDVNEIKGTHSECNGNPSDDSECHAKGLSNDGNLKVEYSKRDKNHPIEPERENISSIEDDAIEEYDSECPAKALSSDGNLEVEYSKCDKNHAIEPDCDKISSIEDYAIEEYDSECPAKALSNDDDFEMEYLNCDENPPIECDKIYSIEDDAIEEYDSVSDGNIASNSTRAATMLSNIDDEIEEYDSEYEKNLQSDLKRAGNASSDFEVCKAESSGYVRPKEKSSFTFDDMFDSECDKLSLDSTTTEVSNSNNDESESMTSDVTLNVDSNSVSGEKSPFNCAKTKRKNLKKEKSCLTGNQTDDNKMIICESSPSRASSNKKLNSEKRTAKNFKDVNSLLTNNKANHTPVDNEMIICDDSLSRASQNGKLDFAKLEETNSKEVNSLLSHNKPNHSPVNNKVSLCRNLRSRASPNGKMPLDYGKPDTADLKGGNSVFMSKKAHHFPDDNEMDICGNSRVCASPNGNSRLRASSSGKSQMNSAKLEKTNSRGVELDIKTNTSPRDTKIGSKTSPSTSFDKGKCETDNNVKSVTRGQKSKNETPNPRENNNNVSVQTPSPARRMNKRKLNNPNDKTEEKPTPTKKKGPNSNLDTQTTGEPVQIRKVKKLSELTLYPKKRKSFGLHSTSNDEPGK